MIDTRVIVPDNPDDEDKFNDAIAMFKGAIVNKYAGRKVRIVVSAVKP